MKLKKNRRAAVLITSVLVLLAILSALPAAWLSLHAYAQVPAAKARILPPTQFIPSHDFDTQHIALDLRFDWEREQLIGTEQIVLAPLMANLRRVELDAANMTIDSVSTSNSISLKSETDEVARKLSIVLDRAYQPGETISLKIKYKTTGSQGRRPGLAGTGLRFIKPTQDDLTRPKQIWSQGESEYNHYWFPCYDHPNDFFTSEITATVEKPLMVVSNGKLLETRENIDGTRSFHWKIEQPHASYLTSIIVGEYVPIVEEYEGIPIITNVYPSQVTEGKITAARLPQMVKFFSEKTGVKYPYAKYAQTIVRDFGGGMENISATTQTDNMIHDARYELDQTSDGLQSHELAHQWFGDYVTCRTWADIWLNESFATYFQAMWDEHSLGRDDFLYLDVKGNQDSYFNAWRQGNRRPIVTKNYLNPDAVFDSYAYPRGGAVLHMLRRNLGEDNWWRAINHYLRKYAHQPVGTEQFRIAIEEATGQSMDWFFDEWLYRMGHPVFRVSQSYDATKKTLTLKVEQVQKQDSTSQFPQVEFFQTPMDVEIATATKTTINRIQIEPKQTQTFTFKVDSQPLIVNFDFNQTVIKEVEFQKTTAELIYQASSDQDVLGRIWAIDQLKSIASATDNAADQEQVIAALTGVLRKDETWGARLEAAAALTGLKSENARAALIAATKDSNARVRARAITSLAQFKDPTLASRFQELLNDPSYAVIRAAALGLGQTKSDSAYEALAAITDTPSWRNTIRASALSGLAALGDKRALDFAQKYAGPGNDPQVRAAAIGLLAVAGKEDPRTFSLISEFAVKANERLDFNLLSASLGALVILGDSRGLALMEHLSKGATDIPQLAGMIRQFQGQLQKAGGGAQARPSP
jgi:aminopeptidase N